MGMSIMGLLFILGAGIFFIGLIIVIILFLIKK